RPLNKTKGCLIANFATVPMALTLSHSIVVSPVGSTLCCGQLQQHVGDFRVSRLYETRKPKTIHVVAQVADVLQQQSLHVRSRIGDSFC
ncbi:hypothetical protein, partial [Salmonella enterica]